MRSKRRLLGAVLLRHGVIDTTQLAEALAYHTTHRCRLGEALIKLGFCTDVAVTRAVAEQVEMPFVNLEEEAPPARILQLIPRLVARQWGVVPVREEDGRVLVVARNPFDFRVDEAVRKAVGGPVTIAFGVEAQIEQALARYDALKPWEMRERNAPVMPEREDRYHLREWTADLGHASDDPKIAEIIAEMIGEALRRNASEVHFEPKQGALYVNARVDEEMVPLGAFPHSQIKPLLARVKQLCGMWPGSSLRRQDGVYHLTHRGEPIEFKARTSPSLPHECIYLKRDIRASRLLPSRP
jgi:type II secretory ATPase GspE/PulE/Tfp pilus assembly ATPase PilB-like protein